MYFHIHSNTKSRKSYLFGFLSGIAVVIIAFGTYWFVKDRQTKETFSTIVAPYYTQAVFQKPAGLVSEKNASISAQTKIKLPVVMYHYIEYVKDAGDIIRKKLDINPFTFNKQLESLQVAGYTTYFVRDIPQLLQNPSELENKKPVVLTFDDGYEDFYTDAFPILKKYNMKATIYLIYDFIGRKGYLTDKEIRELIDSGLVEVGDHTLDHVYLKLAPLSFARKQIFESKRILEDRFGIKVDTFAYPYGAFSQDTINLVKEASFSAAVSVIPGVMQSGDDLYYLYRIRPGMFGSDAARVLDRLNK